MQLLRKLILHIVVRDQRKMAKTLRAEGHAVEADAVEAGIRQLKANPNRTPEEIIFQEKLKLIHEGKHIEAQKFEEIAESALPIFFGDRSESVPKVVLDPDQTREVPSPLRQLHHMLMIWAISFIVGFALLYFAEAPADVDLIAWSEMRRGLALIVGGLIAGAGSIVYVIWTAVRVAHNYRLNKKSLQKIQDKLSHPEK